MPNLLKKNALKISQAPKSIKQIEQPRIVKHIQGIAYQYIYIYTYIYIREE